MENLYLRDFVEYYLNLGFDNILLYDNNDINGEYPQQVIGDYIRSGFVIYKDARGRHRYQLKAYTQCYEEYKYTYEWIAFIDADEYIEITSKKKINEFLSGEYFKDVDIIGLYWLSYGDNGLLHYEKRPVYERFIMPINPLSLSDGSLKLFIKGDVGTKIEFTNVNDIYYVREYSMQPLIAALANGTKVDYFPQMPLLSEFEGAYIKHYHTLTIDEFLYRRFGRRSYADENTDFTKDIVMEIFWRYNEKTPEKEKIVEDFFKSYEITEDIINT